MQTKVAKFAVQLCALALLAGCATTVAVSARFPARNPAAAELRKTAVWAFSGPGSRDFASALQAEITSARFDGAVYFTMVDGGQYEGRADAASAIEYGRRVGAEGVYFGQVMPGSVREEGYTGSGMRCVATNANGLCVKSAYVAVRCTRRVVTLEAQPSLVRVASGQVVYSSRKTASANTSWCEGGQPPATDQMMFAAARRQITTQIRLDIAPYNATLQATLKESSSGLPDGADTAFAAAVASAKKGDMGEACRQWADVDKISPNHVDTTYDLGVCAESSGDYVRALQQYERARTLAPKADNDIAASITRAQRLVEANKGVAQMEEKRAAEAAEVRRQAEEQEKVRASQAKAAKAAQDARRAKLVATHGAANAALIETGQVKVGMSAAAARAAKGAPLEVIKVPGGDEQWRYKGSSITISKGKVTYVGR